ncbi:MAG TPA: type II secretion system protein N [Casimicrobiaceae bacterium]|nr:type II secretion system protein N [Casimicrobiaceae bacterium]
MRALFALGALVLLVFAFAWLAPASLVDGRIAAATEGRVRLADATGTVWRGAGALTDGQGRWQVPLAWRVDAWSLARGAFTVQLVPTAIADARGTMLAERDTVRVSGLHVDVPARALEAFWTSAPVPRLDGMLVVDAPSFASDGRTAAGQFDLAWTGARASLAGLALNLGRVEAHGRPADDAIAIALSGSGGDVALRGTATWRAGRVGGDVTLMPSPGAPPAVAVALRALGRSEPDGTIHLTWPAGR